MAAQETFTPEFAFGFRQFMLGSLAHELELTKKVLVAVPDARSNFRPEPKSRTAWELAWHLANTDVQFMDGIADLNFSMKSPEEADKPKNIADLVVWYDRNMKQGAARIATLSKEQLATPVEFFGVLNLPAVAYLNLLSNHSIHHRGELITYLRPMGSKVPSIYGGSFDEPYRPG